MLAQRLGPACLTVRGSFGTQLGSVLEARLGQLDDPFGHRWNVGQHLRDVPHDEIVAAAARAFA
jgi:hypothetical protein